MPFTVRPMMAHDAIFGYSFFMLPILWSESVLNERNAGSTVKDMGAEGCFKAEAESGCPIMNRIRNRSIYQYQHPV